MKKGDEVQVRILPWYDRQTEVFPWVTAKVELISGNGGSLAVTASKGLGSPGGYTGDSRGNMMLILLRSEKGDPRHYQDIITTYWWEVEADQE